MIRVIDAKHIGGKKIRIRFNESKKQYLIDFAPIIAVDSIQIIRDLQDDQQFQKFKVDHDTLCWENGVDFAPEYLYFLANRDNPTLHAQFQKWGYINPSSA